MACQWILCLFLHILYLWFGGGLGRGDSDTAYSSVSSRKPYKPNETQRHGEEGRRHTPSSSSSSSSSTTSALAPPATIDPQNGYHHHHHRPCLSIFMSCVYIHISCIYIMYRHTCMHACKYAYIIYTPTLHACIHYNLYT